MDLMTRNFVIAGVIGGIIIGAIALYSFLAQPKEKIFEEINDKYTQINSLFPSKSLIENSANAKGTQYTENSETSCVNGKCMTTVYPFTAFTEEETGWHTLNEVSQFEWLGDRWRLSYRNYSVEIKPFVIYNNQYRDFNDIRNAFPNADLKDRVDFERFNRKFSINLTVPQNLVDNTQYIGFELVNSSGLTWDDVQRDGTKLTIKNKITIDFQDILDSHYTLNPVNKTYLLIGNLSANYKDGSLVIDPKISLTSSSVIVDYYTGDTTGFTDYASLMRWDISSIPEGAIIINATLWLNETTTGVATGVDSDLNISRINNQTWDFSTNTTELSEQVDNIEDTFWFNSAGTPIVFTSDKGHYWRANVTPQFNASYDASETYLSLWFEDPDRPWNIYLTKTNDNTLRVGNGRFGFATFSSSSAQLNITYEGETNNPVVNLLTPANESVYTEGTNETFFINVTDDTEIDYVQWWSNFRNGTFISEQTNNTNIINSAIYNFTFNFSTWYGRINYTSLASLASTSNRQITMNGTDWWLVSQSGDFVFHLNSSFENQTDGFSTSTNTLPISLSNNGTELGIIDLGNDNFTRYTYNGVRIDNCSLRNAGGNLNYYAFDYNISDNTIWVLTDQTPSLVWHLDTLCNNLTGAFALDQRIISPSGMALINNTFYVISESTDLLYHYNMGTGIQIANYSAKNILNNGAAIDVTGLTWNRTALSPIENLYTTSASPNVLSSFSRKTINSEPIIWNAYACDIYNNCAFNSTNYTYYFSAPSPENCWFASGKQTHVPYNCQKWINGGELF